MFSYLSIIHIVRPVGPLEDTIVVHNLRIHQTKTKPPKKMRCENYQTTAK